MSFGRAKLEPFHKQTFIYTVDRTLTLELKPATLHRVDRTNWFGNFAVDLQQKAGSGLLSVLDCLSGKEGYEETSHFDVISSTAKGKGGGTRVATVVARHFFLEAGVVTIRSLRASGLLGTVAAHGAMAGPRIVVSSRGRVHSMSTMSKRATASSEEFRWNDEIRLPVVDEYGLTLEAIEYDECTAERETIGRGELSLLPLFKSGKVKVAVALVHSNDIGEKVEGGSVTLKATFEGPPGVVSVLHCPRLCVSLLHTLLRLLFH